MLKTLWAWALASPGNAAISLAVIGFVMNVLIRFFTSKEWALWCESHPRVVGVFLFLKGAFPEGGLMIKGLLQAITGELAKKAGEGKGSPDRKDPPSTGGVGGAVLCLALALSLVTGGCAVPFEEARLAGRPPAVAAAPVGSAPVRDEARCRSLDAGRRDWGFAGKVLAGLTGVAVLSAVQKVAAPSEGVKIGIAVGGAVTGAGAAGAWWKSEDFGATWAKECSQ